MLFTLLTDETGKNRTIETNRKGRIGRGLRDHRFTDENKLKHKDECCWLEYTANYKQNRSQHP